MANFGESLKRERELRDIPLRDIANATKINLRYLEALEANRFDKLPGGVFNKGFIRAYARFIGADGEALVQRYMEEQAQRDAAFASTQPAPDRPGPMRPTQGPPPRRAEAAAGAAADSASPSITFAEGRAASAAVAAVAMRRGGGGAVVIPPFGSSSSNSQARLILAATTVIAAFAALAIVLYLVRSARHDSQPAGSRDQAPASAPETSGEGDGALDAPADSEPMEDGSPSGDPGSSATPGGAPPDAGTEASPAPAPPTPRPLPEIPRERDGSTPPVRVASPVPAPIPEPPKPEPQKQTVRPSPPPSQPSSSSGTPGNPGTGAQGTGAPATGAPIGDAPKAPSAPTGPMTIVVQGVQPTMVQLGCDGVDRPARAIQAGETLTLRCYSLVRISTQDAGAVRLTLDGAACPPLGAAGNRVEHYTIRAEDARVICPSGGGHGRR